MNKYCEGIDCITCDQKEPCIYREANRLYNKIEQIKEIVNGNYETLDPLAKQNILKIVTEVLDERSNS